MERLGGREMATGGKRHPPPCPGARAQSRPLANRASALNTEHPLSFSLIWPPLQSLTCFQPQAPVQKLQTHIERTPSTRRYGTGEGIYNEDRHADRKSTRL